MLVQHSTDFIFVLFEASSHSRELHSFPTRRSSDLINESENQPTTTQKTEQRDSGNQSAAKSNTTSENTSTENSKSESKKDRKSTRLNSSHVAISYAVFCLKKKKKNYTTCQPHLK